MSVTPEYNKLMTKRIRRILLVCNNYDNFSLEEDGHIDSQIKQEYTDLNLSNPPSFERAESTTQALQMLQDANEFDLIISMYNVGEMDVFTFSSKAKQLCPHTPIVHSVFKKLDDCKNQVRVAFPTKEVVNPTTLMLLYGFVNLF